ncbi:MAG: hypothetical protein ACR2MA_05090, partial [Egibacteraceae bacterium]
MSELGDAAPRITSTFFIAVRYFRSGCAVLSYPSGSVTNMSSQTETAAGYERFAAHAGYDEALGL